LKRLEADIANLAARLAKIQKMDAKQDTLASLLIFRRFVSPGDLMNPPTNFIVAQGKVWARREDEDEAVLIARVKAEYPGRALRVEARATAPE
jgi:hypothetical protein